MGGPCGRRHEVSVRDCFCHLKIGVGAARRLHLRRTRRIGRAAAPVEYVGRGEGLGRVANGGHRLALLEEVLHRLHHAVVEAQVLRRPAARQAERVVVGRVDVRERGVEGKVVARLFSVGLVALEVVNGGLYRVASLLVRAHGMDLVPC